MYGYPKKGAAAARPSLYLSPLSRHYLSCPKIVPAKHPHAIASAAPDGRSSFAAYLPYFARNAVRSRA